MSTDFSFIHIIPDEDLRATHKQIAPVIERALAGIGIAADQLHLDDLAAQIEVWKVRDLVEDLNIHYVTSGWNFTPDRSEVQVLFLGLDSKAEVARLEESLCSNDG